jgi:putative transposase
MWKEFLNSQSSLMLACNFFTVDTALLRRRYVDSFIELDARRVHLTGVTAKPVEGPRGGSPRPNAPPRRG